MPVVSHPACQRIGRRRIRVLKSLSCGCEGELKWFDIRLEADNHLFAVINTPQKQPKELPPFLPRRLSRPHAPRHHTLKYVGHVQSDGCWHCDIIKLLEKEGHYNLEFLPASPISCGAGHRQSG